MSIMRGMTMAERLRIAQEEKNMTLEEALGRLSPGEEPDSVRMPGGLRVRLKRPPLSQLLGGNPLNPEGDAGDDELLKMLKVTRGS